jgi:hypothetical protein
LGNKLIVANIAFGGAGDNYPAGGVPLPSIGYFDLYHAIRFATDVVKAGYVYHLDITNHKLMIYIGANGLPMAEFAGAPAATSIEMLIMGQ